MSDMLLRKIYDIFDEYQQEIIGISKYLFAHPEMSGEEYLAVEYMTKILERFDFQISFPLKELPTAFVAEFNPEHLNGKDVTTIAFLPEYDALPGYGGNSSLAHACGHNWIAATMCGCGMILSKFCRQHNFIVKVIGTPAEETFGGKVNMVNSHIFDDIDFVFQSHLNNVNSLEPDSLAMNSVAFSFTGKAAHAAQFPDHGINALDAVTLMFSGVNAMREHFRQDVRVHGIISAGGEAANIVPEFAQCKFSFRARDKQYLTYVRKRIIEIAQGAALMTGASLHYQDYENPFDDIRNLKSFTQLARKHFESAGINGFIAPEDYPPAGSSDIGNVSHVCPTLYVELKPETEQQMMLHDESALSLVDSPPVYELMKKNIGAFLTTALELVDDSETAARIKNEFFNIG